METVLIVEDDRVYARATTNWLVKMVSMLVMYYPWTMQRSFWAIMMWIWYCRIFVSTTAMAWNCWNG